MSFEQQSSSATAPTLTLHHLENSRSQRILWLLEELGVPYDLKIYKRTPEKRAPKELFDVHPLGKSPVLTDGPKLTLAESGAIVEYLISRYGKDKFGLDENSDAWVENMYWAHYSEGSLQPLLTRRFIYKVVPDRTPFFIRPVARLLFNNLDSVLIAPELEKHGKLIESRLEEVSSTGGWLAGQSHPTSSDFILSFTLEVFTLAAPAYAGPKTKQYVEKIKSSAAYQRVSSIFDSI
ncbi:glutathione S-transferase [Coprinopsis cinerea AmutBmut pab1-1]|nr:glutathione S-transferase [Coprinopsis cinerea AmutBmut pab1-1]